MQIVHLKHHAYYHYLTLTQQLTHLIAKWPAFLEAFCLNIGYLSLPELIRIRN